MNAAVLPLDYARPTVVRRARYHDIAGVLRVERAAWPTGECMQADASKFVRRIELGGLFVATRGDRIVGSLTTFRPRWASARAFDEILSDCPRGLLRLPASDCWQQVCRRWRLPIDWHAATADGTLDDGDLHRDDGEVVFGVGIATDPEERGTRVAQSLLDHALDVAAREGARHFVGYGRLPQYHASRLDLDTYLHLERADAAGRSMPRDFGFRLHWYLGAQPARSRSTCRYIAIPWSMRDDPESRDAGALVVTPLRARARFPFESVTR